MTTNYKSQVSRQGFIHIHIHNSIFDSFPPNASCLLHLIIIIIILLLFKLDHRSKSIILISWNPDFFLACGPLNSIITLHLYLFKSPAVILILQIQFWLEEEEEEDDGEWEESVTGVGCRCVGDERHQLRRDYYGQ